MSTDIHIEGDHAPPYAFQASDGLAVWLHDQRITLAITTYDIGKLFLVSAPSPDRLRILERSFDRAMGLCFNDSSLLLGVKNAVVRFQNVVPPGQVLDGYDGLFVPQVIWITGDVFTHDVGLAVADHPIFVNTSFSCLATVDDRSSFRPIWKPPFISQYAPQDRCHLNGLAMAGNRPRFVTMVAATNEGGAWRNYRVGGGLVMDVETNAIVVRNLSMPHSPRLHDGKLWLLQSGSGDLGFVAPGSERVQSVAFCPGFVRGLAFHGGYALVGTSLPRGNALFSGLPLEEQLAARREEAECAVHIVDLAAGRIVHKLKIGGMIREFYEVAVIPGLRNAGLVGIGAIGAGVPELSKLMIKGPDLALADIPHAKADA